MDIEKRNKIYSVLLFIVIVALAYMLYDAITTPYKAELARKAMVERVHLRMSHVRDALVYFRNKTDKFPKEIDSLVSFMKRDSVANVMADSLYGGSFEKEAFSFDKLIESPKTGKRFEYALNDTIRPNIYLLKDPDSDDRIGDLQKTTLLNAPSWQ